MSYSYFVQQSLSRVLPSCPVLVAEAICDNDQVSGISVIIMANKQDVDGALSPGDLAINFYAIQDAAERSRVFPISALTG